MELRQLGTSEIRVSSVAMGCWPIAGITTLNATREDSLRTLEAALESGVNFLDTAYAYGVDGESEEMIGKVIHSRRDDVVVATKGGIHRHLSKTHKWNQRVRLLYFQLFHLF